MLQLELEPSTLFMAFTTKVPAEEPLTTNGAARFMPLVAVVGRAKAFPPPLPVDVEPVLKYR